MSMTRVSLQTLVVSVTVFFVLHKRISFTKVATWFKRGLGVLSAPIVRCSNRSAIGTKLSNFLWFISYAFGISIIMFIRKENLEKCNSKHNTQDRLIKIQEVLFIMGI